MTHDRKRKGNEITPELLAIIKSEYVNGVEDGEGGITHPPLFHLVKKYDVNKTTLYKHRNNEGWDGERQAAAYERQSEFDADRAIQAARDNGRLNDACIREAFGIIKIVHRRRKFIDENLDTLGGKAARELGELTTTLQKAQVIGRLALGQATEITIDRRIGDADTFDEIERRLDDAAERKRAAGSESESKVDRASPVEPTPPVE